MKKQILKLLGLIVTVMLLVTFIIPVQVLGANDDVQKLEVQIVKTKEENYVIYVKGLLKEKFYYLIAESDTGLGYTQSVEDDSEEPNQVALIKAEDANQANEKNLYIKTGKGTISTKLNLEDSFDKSKMEEVETTTKRIPTEVITDIIEKDVEENGVKVKVTVGGLKITDAKNATYYYSSTKLPAEKYTELMRLAENINENYNKVSMYEKIEMAKEFYQIYNYLEPKQNWEEVKDMTIMQPNDAQKGDQYVVFLKKVDEEGNETIDAKLMTSYREDEEEKIPGRVETKTVKETAKLPITGDSIILFVILAVIILVAIIVFIRMKKLQNKESNK